MPPDTTILLEAVKRAQEDIANTEAVSARFVAAMRRLTRSEDSRTFVRTDVVASLLNAGGVFHNLVERYRRREVDFTLRMPGSCVPAHGDDLPLVPDEPQAVWRTVLYWHEETPPEVTASSQTGTHVANVADGRPDSYQEAVARALDLFNSRLSLEQYRQFCDYRRFGVRGSMGGRYVVEIGKSYNVFMVDYRGNALYAYCCAPDNNLPVYDAMLAQKLWIETDERAFMDKANRDGPQFYFFHPVPETIMRYLYGIRS